MQERLKIGLCAVVHPNMPGNDRAVFKQAAVSMEKLQTELSFDLIVLHEPLGSEEDGVKARNFFDEKCVDLTLIFNASLGFGRVILPLARVNSYIGLWSVPEPAPNGVLQLNSFCGLNMYSAIIANYLTEYHIPYKWFYGYPDSQLFLERFALTVRTLKALRAVRTARIGLVGGIANGFENFQFDERILEKKFGTYIQTRHTVEDIVARAKSYSGSDIVPVLETILQEGSWVKERVSREEMDKFARINKAFEEFAEENHYNALCISCWSKFQEVYDIAVCGAMSRLNENGIVAPCEGDVPGAINMLILNALSGKKSTINDLVAMDENDTSVNMWHCGVAPPSWTCKGCVNWDAHFNIGQYEGKTWHGRGVIADFTFKPGEVTISRIDNQFSKLFTLTGTVMGDKESFYGSSGWINNMQMEGKTLSIPDLINTIVVNKIDHHYPMVYGNVENELFEFAAWKNIEVCRPVPYKPYLQING